MASGRNAATVYVTSYVRKVHDSLCPSSCLLQYKPVFLNRPAAARYRALASIVPGRERFS